MTLDLDATRTRLAIEEVEGYDALWLADKLGEALDEIERLRALQTDDEETEDGPGPMPALHEFKIRTESPALKWFMKHVDREISLPDGKGNEVRGVLRLRRGDTDFHHFSLG